MWFILWTVAVRLVPWRKKYQNVEAPKTTREFMSVLWLVNQLGGSPRTQQSITWDDPLRRIYPSQDKTAAWMRSTSSCQVAQSISRGCRAQRLGFQLEKCGFNHQQLGTCRFDPLTLFFNLQNPSNWWFTDLGMFDMGDGHKIYGNVHGKLISKLWGTVSYIQGNRYEQEIYKTWAPELSRIDTQASRLCFECRYIYIFICLV